MRLTKFLLVTILVTHLVVEVCCTAESKPQRPGLRRRLVVKKRRKQPQSVAQQSQEDRSPRQSLEVDPPPYTLPTNFNVKVTRQRERFQQRLSTPPKPISPQVPRFSSFDSSGNRVRLGNVPANPSRAASQSRNSVPYSVNAAAPPLKPQGPIQQLNVPGLAQYQQHLRLHQAQLQRHLAQSRNLGNRPAGNSFGSRVHQASAQSSQQQPLQVVQHTVQLGQNGRVRQQYQGQRPALIYDPRKQPGPSVPRRQQHQALLPAAPSSHVGQSSPHQVHQPVAAGYSPQAHQPTAAAYPAQVPQSAAAYPAQTPTPNYGRPITAPQVQSQGYAPELELSSAYDLPVVDVHQGAGDSAGISFGEVAVAGERCVEKLVTVEETEEDEQIECHHSYTQKCHTTYTTDYNTQQEEDCEETFKKDCFIEYKKVVQNETVEFCHTPLVRDCNLAGPVECTTEYESECETKYHQHTVVDDVPDCVTIKEYKCETVVNGYSEEEECKEWPVKSCTIRQEQVTKVTPETACKKIPKEKCAPAGCGFVEGVPECFDKVEPVVQEVPEEVCDLKPTRTCSHVTKLVPKLEPQEECVDVPNEVCVRSKANPRKVAKPVFKRWCYTPTPESGLF